MAEQQFDSDAAHSQAVCEQVGEVIGSLLLQFAL